MTRRTGTDRAADRQNGDDLEENDLEVRVRLSALVSGEVQGVGFRAFVRRLALDLGVSGYAENLSDGRLEVIAEGEREALAVLLHQLHRGPAHAEVAAVDVVWGEVSGLEGFNAY